MCLLMRFVFPTKKAKWMLYASYFLREIKYFFCTIVFAFFCFWLVINQQSYKRNIMWDYVSYMKTNIGHCSSKRIFLITHKFIMQTKCCFLVAKRPLTSFWLRRVQLYVYVSCFCFFDRKRANNILIQ